MKKAAEVSLGGFCRTTNGFALAAPSGVDPMGDAIAASSSAKLLTGDRHDLAKVNSWMESDKAFLAGAETHWCSMRETLGARG